LLWKFGEIYIKISSVKGLILRTGAPSQPRSVSALISEGSPFVFYGAAGRGGVMAARCAGLKEPAGKALAEARERK